MTPSKAAKVIGCSPQQVRTLIRTGVLRATKTLSFIDSRGQEHYTYVCNKRDVKRYASKPQGKGYPRGRSRK